MLPHPGADALALSALALALALAPALALALALASAVCACAAVGRRETGGGKEVACPACGASGKQLKTAGSGRAAGIGAGVYYRYICKMCHPDVPYKAHFRAEKPKPTYKK